MTAPHSLTSTELQSRTDAALELATIVTNLNDSYINGVGEAWIGSALFSHMRKLARAALGQSEILPDPEFSRFLNWARSEGKDCAYTFDTERNQWVAPNPATADLWRVWRVALGVEGTKK